MSESKTVAQAEVEQQIGELETAADSIDIDSAETQGMARFARLRPSKQRP